MRGLTKSFALMGGAVHRTARGLRAVAGRAVAVIAVLSMTFVPCAALSRSFENPAGDGYRSQFRPSGFPAVPAADTVGGDFGSVSASADASDNGVAIKLFDYSMERRYDRRGWRYQLVDPSINDGHAMKFGDIYDTYTQWNGRVLDARCSHPAQNQVWNCWTDGYGDPVHPGIVASKLTNGYPTLNPTVTNSSESLAYLFGGESDDAVTPYGVSGGLLMRGADGYYEFSSSEKYARYDASSGRFTLTDGTRSTQSDVPNFTPFNDLSDTSYDYAFGMTIESKFYMPKGGKTNGSDMVFDFSGDDDIWLFIDGALVLDLGGIHGDRGGSVNFASGAITYDQAPSSWWQVTRPSTLADAMKQAGLTWDSSDYKQHTFTLFYLERGGGGSNCRMRFNLPTIPQGTVEIAKTVDFGTAVPLDGTAFRFQAFLDYDGSNQGTNFEQFFGTYDVVDSAGVLVTADASAADGAIVLRNGQIARLKPPPGKTIRANTRYYVIELGVSDADYVASASGMTLMREAAGMSTPTLEVQDISHVEFTNTVAQSNTFTVHVAKQCSNCPAGTVNYMMVTVGGAPFSGAYAVSAASQAGSAADTVKHTASNGILALSPGQTATIAGIVGGNSVTVREVNSDGSAFSAPGFLAPAYAMAGTALNGAASTPSDGGITGVALRGNALPAGAALDVTVSNAAKTTTLTPFATVRKTVNGHAGDGGQLWRDGDTFSFRMVPVDADGKESYGNPLPSACAGATAADPCKITATKPADGAASSASSSTVDFGTLTLVAAGTYHYRVTEIAGSEALQQIYHYSRASYDVVVMVKNSASSDALEATVSARRITDDSGAAVSTAVAPGDPLDFTNTSFESPMLPLAGSRSEAQWALAATLLAALAFVACLAYAAVQRTYRQSEKKTRR